MFTVAVSCSPTVRAGEWSEGGEVLYIVIVRLIAIILWHAERHLYKWMAPSHQDVGCGWWQHAMISEPCANGQYNDTSNRQVNMQ